MRMCNRRSRLAFLFSSVAFLGFGSVASAETAISGSSPNSLCTADLLNGQEGQNYAAAEVEPFIAAAPRNVNNLIAVWQQDRWSNGGARSNSGAYSLDGGVTWKRSTPSGTTLCTGGIFERSSDPWVTIAPNGKAFFMHLVFQNDEVCPNGDLASGDNALLVNTSTDGGKTWSAPRSIIVDSDGQKFNDKNAMQADPYDSRYIYATWDKLIDFTFVSSCDVDPKPAATLISTGSAKAIAKTRKVGRKDAVVSARERMRKARLKSARKGLAAAPVVPPGPSPKPIATPENSEYTGPTYFARSTNNGLTWERERLIFDPGPDAQTIGNLVEVLPNGHVLNFMTHIFADGTVKLGYVRSRDKGARFERVRYAVDMNVTLLGTQTPDAEEPVRDANILFDSAVDPKTGNIYLVWQDGRDGDIDKVAFSMSSNGGYAWSAPVIIAKTPANANPLRTQSFVPSVEVGNNGKIHVTYYDFRFDRADGKEMADYWAISCNPRAGADCRNAASWGGETRLTTRSFNMLDAPVARGHFLGDYMGLARAGSRMVAVFGKAVRDNVNDMFFAVLPR